MRILYIVPLWFLSSPLTQAATLHPGDLLRLDFTVNTPPICAGGPCDTLWPFVPRTADDLVTDYSATLKDGNIDLATNTSTGWWYFRSSSSAFALGSVADFKPILDGTMEGEIDFTIAGGQVQGLDLPGAVVYLGHAFTDCCFGPNQLTPTLTTALIATAAVPEPGAWAMLILGGALLLAAQRFRRVCTQRPAYSREYSQSVNKAEAERLRPQSRTEHPALRPVIQ